MEQSEFKQRNLEIGAGENKDCDSLKAGVAVDPYGYKCIVAKFKMTEEEKKHFLEHGEIWISLRTIQIPPFMLTPYNPYRYMDYQPLKLNQ